MIICHLQHLINGGLKRKSQSVSCSVMSDSETPWTVACQAPLSTGLSKQEYWSVLSFPLLKGHNKYLLLLWLNYLPQRASKS